MEQFRSSIWVIEWDKLPLTERYVLFLTMSAKSYFELPDFERI